MKRLAKNLILATAAVSAIFLVDLSSAEATIQTYVPEKISSEYQWQTLDFWGKFRDTVMPDPDKPQNNNPPKEMRKPKPVDKPKPAPPAKPAN